MLLYSALRTCQRTTQTCMTEINKLSRLIHDEITQSGGHITFARYMELALYAPNLGYYSANQQKFGKDGDFITAPEISPLFGKCIANQCEEILKNLQGGSLLELGAGTGRLACDVLLALEEKNQLPENYFILEISPDLRIRQRNLLTKECPHLLSKIHWLNELPNSFSGVILGNEVLDALPVNCFTITANGIKERSVGVNNEGFHWKLTEPTQTMAPWLDDIDYYYESEINLQLPAWLSALNQCLRQGAILFFDYGYGRQEYYHPDRNTGTLMCHYQHHRHTDPFKWVGLQDITAHVDFTQVAESALEAQLAVKGYTTQTSFLLSCGLLDLANQDLSELEKYKQNQSIKKLTLPSEMGEIIKVMALTKEYGHPLLGFHLYDRRKDL